MKLISLICFAVVTGVLWGCSAERVEASQPPASPPLNPAEAVGAASGQMTKATFEMAGMDCGVCIANVGRVLDETAGVQEFEIVENQLMVKFDDGLNSADNIKAVLETNTTSKASLSSTAPVEAAADCCPPTQSAK